MEIKSGGKADIILCILLLLAVFIGAPSAIIYHIHYIADKKIEAENKPCVEQYGAGYIYEDIRKTNTGSWIILCKSGDYNAEGNRTHKEYSPQNDRERDALVKAGILGD